MIDDTIRNFSSTYAKYATQGDDSQRGLDSDDEDSHSATGADVGLVHVQFWPFLCIGYISSVDFVSLISSAVLPLANLCMSIKEFCFLNPLILPLPLSVCVLHC